MQMSLYEISVSSSDHRLETRHRLDQLLETLSVQAVHTEELRSTTSKLAEKVEELTLVRTATLPPYSETSPHKQGVHQHLGELSSHNDEGSVIQLRAGCYRKTCRPWCSCCCHVRKSVKMPHSLRGFLGSLFVGYSGVPFVTPPCNERQCSRRSTVRFI